HLKGDVQGRGPARGRDGVRRVVRGGEWRLEAPGVRAQRERPPGQDLCARSGYLRPVRGGEHDTCCWHSQRMAPCSVMPWPTAPRLVTGVASGIVPTLPSFQ